MKQEEDLKPEAKQSTLSSWQAFMMEKGEEWLNKQTKMFLKQQNEGMNKSYELEAMK